MGKQILWTEALFHLPCTYLLPQFYISQLYLTANYTDTRAFNPYVAFN